MRSADSVSDKKIIDVVGKVREIMQDIFGNKLQKVILYGSYAREEQEIYSDMDIMVLVDMDEGTLVHYDAEVFDRTYELTQEYSILLSVMAKSTAHFQQWIDVLPFYNNISIEGVEFYAR